jgi:DNA-binding GntR family transcriptional regulator
MTAKQAPTPTKQQFVYDALRERIIDRRYGPGFRIVIDQVAAEFSVSALPVREAIRRLEAEGLVVYRANAGAQVAPAEPELYEHLMELLAVLEGYATALAAPHLTAQDLAALEDCTAAMVAAMARMESVAFGAHNRAFHSLIYERCPNPSLRATLTDVDRRLDAIRSTVFVHIPYRGAHSVAEHHELVALLRDRAPAARIEAAARAHKLATLDSFRAWQREQETKTD